MGRTKPCASTDHNNSFGKAEVMVLRKNNQSIAKLLSQTKEDLRKNERQLLALQEENMGLMVENRNLSRENRRLSGVNETLNALLRNVYQASKAQMPHLQKLVETFTYILCESGKSASVGAPMSQEVDTHFGLMPPSPHSSVTTSPTKRQAVKPMVGGHIIHRPTINLPRLATEELARLAADVANSSGGEPDDANDEYNITDPGQNDYETNEDNDGNDDRSSESPPPDSPNAVRLDTLQEVDENVSSMNSIEPPFGGSSGNAPLLAGVFRDLNLKVYLSPLRNVPTNVRVGAARPSDAVAEQSSASVGSTSSRDASERSIRRSNSTSRSVRSGARPVKRPVSVDFPLASPPNITKRKRTSTLGLRRTTADHSTLVNDGSMDERSEEDRTIVNVVGNDVATETDGNVGDDPTKIETLSVLGLSPLKYTSTPCTSHSSFRRSLEAYPPTTPIPANNRRLRKSLPRRPSCKVMVKHLALPARRSKSPPKERREDSDDGSSGTAMITPEKRRTRNDGRSMRTPRSKGGNSKENGSPREPCTPGKVKKTKSSKAKKSSRMPSCKVMVKQLSLLKKRSLSPLKVNNEDGGTRLKSSSDDSPTKASVSPPKFTPKNTVSPRKSTPRKLSSTGRPIRAKRPTSLKEKPLHVKMRREK